MRKLKSPNFDPLDVYDTCIAEVTDTKVKKAFVDGKPQVALSYQDFDNATAASAWAQLPRAPWGRPEYKVVGNLTKKAMMDLYSNVMVASDEDARDIYDQILVSNGGTCALCGGLGHVKTLDHYLPKSTFPQYSIHPRNLVPCCRDCNTGKSSSFGQSLSEQVLHPYLDDDKFFRDRWVFAEVAITTPLTVKYSCIPPSSWTKIDIGRALKHFKDYNLAARFSIQGSAEIAEVINLRSKSLRSLSHSDFRAYLIDHAETSGFDLNGWNRTMYTKLSETTWFCEIDFRDPRWLSEMTERMRVK